jgi:hypothetical protein
MANKPPRKLQIKKPYARDEPYILDETARRKYLTYGERVWNRIQTYLYRGKSLEEQKKMADKHWSRAYKKYSKLKRKLGREATRTREADCKVAYIMAIQFKLKHILKYYTDVPCLDVTP